MKDNIKNILKNIFVAIGFIVLAELVGFASSFLAGNIREVYNSLSKPPLAPMPIIFAIVWPILYAMIGLSIFFIWKNQPANKKELYFLQGLQLLLNFLWSIVFFRLQLYFTALTIIVLLVSVVCVLIYKSFKTTKISAYLLVPYVLWLLFATYLNVGFMLLN